LIQIWEVIADKPAACQSDCNIGYLSKQLLAENIYYIRNTTFTRNPSIVTLRTSVIYRWLAKCVFSNNHSCSNSNNITNDNDNCHKITDNDEDVVEQQLQQWWLLVWRDQRTTVFTRHHTVNAASARSRYIFQWKHTVTASALASIANFVEFFNAQGYASAVYAYVALCPSVRLSACHKPELYQNS